jgi:hypothetical protein
MLSDGAVIFIYSTLVLQITNKMKLLKIVACCDSLSFHYLERIQPCVKPTICLLRINQLYNAHTLRIISLVALTNKLQSHSII